MSDREGGCACGAIRFRFSEALPGAGVCHCLDCQKSTGGGPNYVALVPRTVFEVTHGAPKVFTCRADSGAEVGRAFCGDCGSPLWGIPRDDMPFFTVTLGALDQPADYAPVMHLYTDSAQPWHLMHEGVPAFPRMPPMAPPGV